MEEIKMKDSGIKWIGQIPEDWDVKRLKYCVNKFGGGGTPESSNDEFYDDEHGVNWVAIGDMSTNPYVESTDRKVTELGIKDKQLTIYPKGTVIYSIYATIGKVAELKVPSTINQALLAIIENKEILNKNYLKMYLNFLENIVLADTSTNTQANLNLQKVQNFMVCLPPLIKQQRIAEFLDKKCADIDEIVLKTEKQIETLEQYKKSLITETVTKGLKNSKLINSDIKWIGEIPFDWNTKKIKYVATLKGRIGWQGLTSDEYQDEGPYLITGVDFLDGQINWENCVHIPEKRWTEAVDIRIKENDLLITKDGTVGKVALVKNLKDKASLNSGVLLINLEEEYDKKYLFWVLQSDIFWKWFYYTNSGNSTIIHLYQHDFDNFEYPIPPMKEQKEIAAFLDMKCEKTDKIIKQQKESLETLKKYKQSLIYEYVTGKKRV